jgi:hypothetical protein
VTLDALRTFAVSRSLFDPLPLGRAIEKLGFVQADPIRHDSFRGGDHAGGDGGDRVHHAHPADSARPLMRDSCLR